MKRSRHVRWITTALLTATAGTALVIAYFAVPSAWLTEVLRVVGHLSAIASVIALALAIWQTKDARLIRDSLSTRYLGEFPEYLDNITEILKKARFKIIIVCDFPSYGRFSRSDIWIDYKAIIEKRIDQGVEVSFVCMTPELRQEFSRKQFFKEGPSDVEWHRHRSSNPFRLKLEKLLTRHPQHKVESLMFDTLIELLEEEDRQAYETTFANAKRDQTLAPMPLYFWIVDEEVAVFSFPAYANDKTEFGFLTSDHKLIASFVEVYERYRARPS